MRKYLCIAGCLILILTIAQSKAFSQDDKIVAKIGDKNISLSDFNKILGYFDPDKQKLIESNTQLKEALLNQIIQTMVVSDFAKKEGYDKKPEVKDLLDFFKDNFLANEYLKKEVAGKATISEDELKAYYDKNPDEFKTPEMVRARHILIMVDKSATEEDKKKAKQKAEDILKKALAGDDFAKLASEFSDDTSSKSRGGDLGFFPRGMMVKSFEDAAFSLKPGEISGIVESQFGYHIIKLEEKKEPGIESFENVKDTIKQKLLQTQMKTKIKEFIDNKIKEAGVETHPELLTVEKK
jgi:peptidyl-prolyl cis-trans isomerase C